MSLAIEKEKRYTYNDYLTWDYGERWEIIDGQPYNMTPAPKVKHQDLASNFHIKLKTDEKNRCYTGIAPTDVVLDQYNIVQPDVFVVCDRDKIKDNNIEGAPDLIIEVLAPGTEVKDKREKKRIYEQFGVNEYLLVYPEQEYLERYWLENNRYGAPEIFNWNEPLKLLSLDMEVKLWEIFDKTPSPE
ncbi:MAG: Uma2 family endonuclease [Syntrophus sp. (in: bacteria)]|nr:Uma2 family endonuclease [Syntrophus sp. (in: bacteria)]